MELLVFDDFWEILFFLKNANYVLYGACPHSKADPNSKSSSWTMFIVFDGERKRIKDITSVIGGKRSNG